jgi:hypothetical protein
MKKLLLLSVAAFQLIGCTSMKGQKLGNQDVLGVYKRQESTERIELRSDGTYTLFNSESLFTPVFEQCEYASKGKWSVLSGDVLEITSEDNYLKQNGFEYEIKKENKLSQDSLYIQVIFPAEFHPVKLNFGFNYNNSKSIITEKTFIAISKSEHLKRISTNNLIEFSLYADASGTTIYRGRLMFNIFEEYLDTEKYNFLTISLPNFDRCFFEFEPYNKELIFIKNKNQLFWKGEIWKK